MSDRLQALIHGLRHVTAFDGHVEGIDSEGTAWVEIEVHGVDFLFVHEADRPDDFMVYGRLGAIATETQTEFLRHLLATNLAVARRGHAGYGLEVETDEVLYIFGAAFASIGAGVLLDTMRLVAHQADEWRSRHFLHSGRGE